MKKLRFLCCSLAAVMALAACSTKVQNTETTAPPDTFGKGDQMSQPASDTAQKTTGEKQKVVWWSWQPSDKVMDIILPAFEEAHPEIELEYWRGELPDYQKKLQVAIASGEGPDIIGVQVGAMLNQYSKFLEPMEPVAEELMGADWQSNFVEDALNECKAEDGTQVALPATVSGVQFIMYNKTLFDEAGIEGPPATYEEWKADIEMLRKANPDVIPVVFGAKGTDVCVDMFNALSQQFGPGKIYEAEKGLIPWTDPVFVDTMKAWKQMFDDKVFQDGAIGLQMYPDASINYFFARKAAMFMTGTWQTGSLTGNGPKANGATKDDEFGMFILPQIGPNKPQTVASTDWAIGINKDSKNKEAAKVVIDFMTRDQGIQIVANQLGASSANKNIAPTNMGELASQIERDAIQTGIDSINTSAGKRLLSNKELVNALGVAMQDVVTGKDIEKALQEVQDTYERVK